MYALNESVTLSKSPDLNCGSPLVNSTVNNLATTDNCDLPTVSIIIVNFNGKAFLKKCLNSLSQLNYPSHRYEVILVDNGSKDGSTQYIRENFTNVRVLALSRNFGFCGGNNRGAEVALGQSLVFLNNDVEVDKNWLRELVKVAYSSDSIGICGSKVFYMDAPGIIQFAGGYLHTLGGAVSMNYGRESTLCQTVSTTGYVIGCSLLIKKNVFNLIGGFDEDYYMYGEEGDLCWRAWIFGYAVMYNPQSFLYHVGGASRKDKLVKGKDFELKRGFFDARAVSQTSLYHGNKNAIFTFLKNLEAKYVPSAYIFSLVLMLSQFANLLIDKKMMAIPLVVKSWWWPISNFRLIYQKRVKIQSLRRISDKTLLKNNILIPVSSLIALSFESMKHSSKPEG